MQKFLRIAVITYLVYLALALLIISPVLNVLPHRYLEDNYGWELDTGWLLLNPFKLSLDISDAALKDPDGETVLSFSRGSVNLSVGSLWRPGWVLDEFSLQNIFLGVTRISEEEYNFSSLLPQGETEEQPEEESGGIPNLTIRQLDIHSDSILLSDRAREKAYSSRWDGLHIRATDLSTVVEGGKPYEVDLQGDGGGTLHWEGEVSLPKGTSEGQLTVSNLNLRKLWEFAEPWLEFELKQGRLAAEGDYRLDWSEAFRYEVDAGRFGLSSIEIQPRDVEALPDTSATLQDLDVGGIDVDGASQSVAIDTITVNGLALAAWMEEETVSLVHMFVGAPLENEAAPAGAGEKAEEEEQTQEEEEEKEDENSGDAGWSVTLGKAQLSDSSLNWRSRFTDPAMLEITPIEATVENVSWPFSGETNMTLTLSINEEASFELGGTLELSEGAGTINYLLDGLPLGWFNPNLPKALQADIASGTAGVEGELALTGFAPQTVSLAGAVKEFALRMDGEGGRLTGWETLRIEGLDVDVEQHDVKLERLAIDGFVGQVHIQEDGSINASNVWKDEVSETAEDIAEAADDIAGEKPWGYRIDTVSISDSEIDYMDKSLPIQFRAVVGEIEGELQNIDSAPGAVAEVDIEGSVDQYAPVALNGTLSPFDTPMALDLNLTFDSVDMATLSPYSGTYAGYAIDRGLLDLDLAYKLEDNQLQGRNGILIDKLKLGDKIESDKAVDVPLELALAIMTDANGVIDMKIPVSGDVSSPDFELGSVITTALVNSLTRIVTAPFTLLAGLADSEEDLQRLSFSPGYAELTESTRGKLDSLAGALEQRPALSLVITGRINREEDIERMQKNTLKAEFREEGLSQQDIDEKGERWEKAISKRYKKLPGSTGDAATSREQYVAVYETFDIPEDALVELAQARAVATKGYLVNEAGLAPDRAVVSQPDLDDEANNFSGVELGVGS